MNCKSSRGKCQDSSPTASSIRTPHPPPKVNSLNAFWPVCSLLEQCFADIVACCFKFCPWAASFVKRRKKKVVAACFKGNMGTQTANELFCMISLSCCLDNFWSFGFHSAVRWRRWGSGRKRTIAMNYRRYLKTTELSQLSFPQSWSERNATHSQWEEQLSLPSRSPSNTFYSSFLYWERNVRHRPPHASSHTTPAAEPRWPRTHLIGESFYRVECRRTLVA